MTNPIADPLVAAPDSDVASKLVHLEATPEGVATVVLNRPLRRNAFNAELIAALHEAFETLQGAEGVRIVFLRGAGGRPKQQTRTNTNDNIFSRDKVELVLALGEGPIEGLAKPDRMAPLLTGDDFRNFFVGDVPLRRPDNTDNFEDLNAAFFPGSGLGETVKLTYGGQANQVDVGVNIQKLNPVKRLTPPELRGRIKKIEVRIVITQLYTEDASGTRNNTAEFSIKYKKARASDLTFINLTSGPYYDGISTHMNTAQASAGPVVDVTLGHMPLLHPRETAQGQQAIEQMA